MRIKGKLLAIVVAILTLAGIFVVLSLNLDKKGNGTVDNVDVNQSIEIMSVDADILCFSISSSAESYSISKNNNLWTVDGKSNVKLEQGNVSSVISKAKFLYADSLVAENAGDLAAFGLDNPALVVEMTDSDNNLYKVNFGMQTGTKSGYYTTVNDEDEVYVVSTTIFDSLNGGLASLRSKNIVSIDGEVTGFSIINPKSSYTIRLKITEDVNANNLTRWEMITPYLKDVNQSIFEKNVVEALDFTITDFIDDNPTDYSKYGLNNPKYSITVNTQDKTYKVLLGNDKDGSSVYIKTDNEPNVYSISKEKVKYRDFEPVYLLDSYVFIKKLISVDNVVFNAGETYVLKTSDADFYINNKRVEEALFRSAYESIITPLVSGEVNGGTVGKELCRFTFNYNTNTPSETVVYYEYGNMYAAASVNGNVDFYVKRSYVDNMINAVKKLAE